MNPRHQRQLRLACLFLAPLALSACQGKESAAEATPPGEVLPASVSDAMLPLDTVRSQPPFAPQTEAAGKSTGGRASAGTVQPGSDGDSGAENADAPATAAPAAAPSATPDPAQ
jgi:hypothetical protein